MMLCLALHDMGYGTCMLNWCVSHKIDERMRKIISINPSEIIVMLISVGVLPDKFRVARSQRKPLEDVLRIQS